MTVKIEGMDKFDKAMGKLIKSLDADSVEPVLYRGAETVTGAVQRNVDSLNKVTGNLRRSPVTKQMPVRRQNQPRPTIAAIDRSIAPHAWLVERSTGYFRRAWDTTRRTVKSQIISDLSKLVKGAVK